MKIFNKLLSAFLVVVAFMLVIGGIAIFELDKVNEQATEIKQNWLPSIRSALELRSTLRDFRNSELQHVLSVNEADMARYENRMKDSLDDFRKTEAAYAGLITTQSEKQLHDQARALMVQYLGEHEKIIELSRNNHQEEAIKLLRGRSFELRSDIDEKLKKIIDINVAGANESGKVADETYANARILVVSIMSIAAALSIALAYVIARGLKNQLGGEPADAAALAGEIASGNLSATVPLRDDDQSSLMYSLASMKTQLTHVVHGIKTSSDAIAIAAEEIAQGNTDLSQRTEQQAASLEETAASMEELTTTVRQNADSARNAASLAESASALAERGGEMVSRVVDTMQGISESSSKVAEIVAVIDSIAFQTNILALNAAVEAARAGEQGRGFAVVAGEVRTLAQRSASSAREIRVLIEQSATRVDAGAKLVEDAGTTIADMVRSVQSVTNIIAQISSASLEQTTGIEQVNTAVSQMDQVTQQNAALVEQASAAAQSLAEQAGTLREAVAVFKLDESRAHRTADRMMTAASYA